MQINISLKRFWIVFALRISVEHERKGGESERACKTTKSDRN